ncbi:MAG: histidine phosphotransferase [Deltaproteobacteria bacterium]|nr:MAG: histidine phosphotransferase [Deltaproteobacteria bacterium]
MADLDWNKEFALEQADDDAALLGELLDIFKDSMISDLAAMKTGMDAGNAAQACEAAHSVKGAALSLGIVGISDVALAIEKDCRAGSLEICKKKYPLLLELQEELKKL